MNLFKDYFSFTKKERKGIYTLIILIIAIALLPQFFRFFIKDEPIDSTDFQKAIATLKIDSAQFANSDKTDDEYYNDYTPDYKTEKKVNPQLFYFDPNTASEADWLKLGISKRTTQTIQNYLAKGGRFYKPEDIQKIYGLKESDAKRLIPFVKIVEQKKEYSFQKNSFPAKKTFEKKTIEPFDINTADSSDFKTLPGIGPVLSKRIVTFRQKLGGFYSVDQVAETYNLPDSTFKKIRKYLLPDSKAIKKININTATLDELKAHPYISYSVANAIFQYRQQHGNFISIDDLKKIMSIDDKLLEKIAPYLSTE
ncbi:MAG: ComEA family DNA-binding protein [Ginsengibacter sp.]